MAVSCSRIHPLGTCDSFIVIHPVFLLIWILMWKDPLTQRQCRPWSFGFAHVTPVLLSRRILWCLHRTMCSQMSLVIWIIPVIRPAQIRAWSLYCTCINKGPLYLFPALFTVAGCYSLSADSGTIFSLHLSPARLANPPTVLKTAQAKFYTQEAVVSSLMHNEMYHRVQYSSWKFVFHILSSKCCIFPMCFTELCMKEGQAIPPLITCIHRDTIRAVSSR